MKPHETHSALATLLDLPIGDVARICAGELPAHIDPARPLAIGAFDPVGIQDLVLTSRRPKGMLGASLLLGKWDEQAKERARTHGVHSLYAGGGQSFVVGSEERVRAWAAAEKGAFREWMEGQGETEVLPCTVGALVRGPQPWKGVDASAAARLGVRTEGGGGFGALLGVLSVRLRVAKDKADFAVEGHDKKRCQDSGLLPVAPGSYRSRLCAKFNKAADHLQTGRARWRDEGLSFADLPGGCAFIAIDGTSVGAKLQSLKTVDEYVQFSHALSQAFGYKALKKHLDTLRVDEDDWIPITAGGDDLLLAVGASARFDGGRGPLELLHALLERIRREFDDAIAGTALEPVGAGAGLVVGEGVTARIGLDLAKDLVESAKTVMDPDDPKKRARFAVDFEYLRRGSLVSRSLSELRKLRERTWYPPGSDQAAVLCLGQRPFSLQRSCELAQIAAETMDQGQTGRGTLYQLRSALDEDPMPGLVTAAYLLSRLNPESALARGLALPREQVGAGVEGWPYPLLTDEGRPSPKEARRFSSAVPDIVEMATLRLRAERTIRE